MGQSLLNITCPEDHETLRNNLKYHSEKLTDNIGKLIFFLK